jgi:hypothetical protein
MELTMIKKIIGISIGFLFNFQLIAVVPEVQQGFPVHINNSDRVFGSSPAIIDLNNDNIPEIIFGASTGKVHVYHGNGTEYWTTDTGNASIESKPAVADINNDGVLEIVVTSGRAGQGTDGLLTILNGQTGNIICTYVPPIFSNSAKGIYGSVALANLDTSDPELEIAVGDWGATVNVLNHDCSILWRSRQSQDITGVPLEVGFDETLHGAYVNDTVWSSPAIYDINQDGQLDIIIGVDSHVDDNNISPDGGRLLAINGLNGNLIFAVNTDEVIFSSPAVADIDNNGTMEIIVATGFCWQNPSCAPGGVTHNDGNQIYAFDSTGQNLAGWPYVLPNGYANLTNSPAIADIDNDGFLEVVINAFDSNSSPTPQYDGRIFVIEHTGQLKWSAEPNVPAGQVNHTHYAANSASPIIADITGDNNFEIIIPSNWELVVFDNNGTQISREVPSNIDPNAFTLLGTFPFLSTPVVVDIDNDGDYEIVAVSGTSTIGPPRPASIYAWDLTKSTDRVQPWASFRNSIRNLGVYIIDFIFADGFEIL